MSEIAALEEISKMCGEVKSKEKDKTASPANNNFAAENIDAGYHFTKDKIVQDDLGHSQNNKSADTSTEDIPYIFGKDTSDYHLPKKQIIQDDLSHSPNNKAYLLIP